MTGQSVGKWDLMSRNVKLPITGKGILATATVWMISLSKYSGLWEGSGITFTSDLKAATHCREAYSKANCVLGLISRTIRPKNKNPVVLTNLYKLMASQTSPGTLHSLHGIAWITILNSKTRYCLKKFASLACSLTWRSYHIGLGLRRQTESVETVVSRGEKKQKWYDRNIQNVEELSAISWSRFFHGAEDSRTQLEAGNEEKLSMWYTSAVHFFSQRVINRWNRTGIYWFPIHQLVQASPREMMFSAVGFLQRRLVYKSYPAARLERQSACRIGSY